MAKAKYQIYYDKMIEENKALFTEFKEIHDDYAREREKAIQALQDEFHSVGQKVVDRIRDWDRRLCSAMGKGLYSSYSEKLSEKFWNRVRQDYPQIDLVGVRIKK